MSRSGSVFLLAFVLGVLSLGGCRSSAPAGEEPQPAASPIVLISLDGFMPEYLERYDTPHLDRLAGEGVRAESLIPSFPTKTFPNHYTVVTGLYPAHHGIISNTMYDPVMDASFSLSNREAIADARWWGGEPIWVTAEMQGVTAATFFWPGSEAAVQGVRPTYWKEYEHEFPNAQRVDTVLAWLDLPEESRPSIITLYFADVDSDGHRYGPYSAETERAVAHVDSMVGRVMDGLAARGIHDEVNLIIVSDHGMAETSPERVIILDDYVDPATLRFIDRSPVLMAEARGVDAREVIAALDAAPHLSAYHRDELPERWHFRDHLRIPTIVAVADDGYTIATRDYFERSSDRISGGTHGYDNALPSMQAIFLARGPSFKEGEVVGPFANVHLYNLMASMLGINPAPNDGSPDSLLHVLRNQRRSLLHSN